MADPIELSLKATNVCRACHVGKQRCDKALPQCSRCSKKGISCTYTKSAELRFHNAANSMIEQPLVQRQCQNCYDLTTHGAYSFSHAAMEAVDLPHEQLCQVVDAVFQSLDISTAELLDEYFDTIHEWLPILNQVKVRQSLTLVPSDSSKNALALLTWAMYLVTRRPCPEQRHSMHNSTYRVAKQLFMFQATEHVTLELLQTGLLITYYACGHGFIRDAYILLTTCLSMARILGIPLPPNREDEPEDSEWFACGWAIILLDRTIALSCFEDPLPCLLHDNPSFDLQDFETYMQYQGRYRSFVLTARVAHLIGEAIDVINQQEKIVPESPAFQVIYDQLNLLMRKLVGAASLEPDTYTYCGSTSFVVCMLLGLQALNVHHVQHNQHSKEALDFQSTMVMVRDKFDTATDLTERGQHGVIPPIANCVLGRAAVTVTRLDWRNYLHEQEFQQLKLNLERFGSRWRVAVSCVEYMDQFG